MAAKTGIQLSDKFEAAIQFAIRAHAGQFRKGNRAPYVSHPLMVASLVLECGGTETLAIAALLHDTIEDCDVTKEEIAQQFGEEVAKIVDHCTEKLDRDSHGWRERKTNYLTQLQSSSPAALFVVICDKFHNLSSLLQDIQHRQELAWSIYKAPREEIIWYYEELAEIFCACKELQDGRLGSLIREFERQVKRLQGSKF